MLGFKLNHVSKRGPKLMLIFVRETYLVNILELDEAD